MKLKFAVPVIDGKLCSHFGRCQGFAIIDTENSSITGTVLVAPPVHEPGSYPKFLADKGVNKIIAGGMGMNARKLFDMNNIEVCMGVNADTPETLVEEYMKNELVTGENQCDGGHEHGHNCNH